MPLQGKRKFHDDDGLGDSTDPFLHEQLITIALEDSEERFLVSKALLCYTSDYFRRALDGNFKESFEGLLRLPGCDETTLRLFIKFMSARALPEYWRIIAEGGLTEDDLKEESQRMQSILIKLWAFGDQYLISKLQDAAMSSLAELLVETESGMDPECVQLAFDLTAKGSVMRAMITREVVGDWKWGRVDEDTMNQLGLVPKFFVLFFAMLKECPEEDCLHDPPCRAVQQETLDKMYCVSKE